MTAITKCNGVRQVKYLSATAVCPLRDKCVRYTTPIGLNQSWIEAPFTIKDRAGGLPSCVMFWRDKKAIRRART